MQKERLPILIIAPTGEFGTHITQQCLKIPSLLVNVLVRNPDKNKELMDAVRNAGGRVIQGDVTQPETLKDCTKGIHTVVSSVVGDFKTVVDGQTYLLEDGLKNGIKRFVPSDYSLDIWGIPKGEHYFTDQRLIFREKLEKSPIKGLHASLGFFMEAFIFFNQSQLTYWGDSDTKIDLTSQEDAAKFLAAAVARPDRVGDLKVAGDQITVKEAQVVFKKVLGKDVEVVKGGSIDDLRRKVIEAKEAGDMSTAIGMGYNLFCWDGRAKIREKMNDEFPEVKPLTFEEFLKKYGKNLKYDFFVPNLPKSAEEEMKRYPWGPKANVTV